MCRSGIGRYISEIANRKAVHFAMSVPMLPLFTCKNLSDSFLSQEFFLFLQVVTMGYWVEEQPHTCQEKYRKTVKNDEYILQLAERLSRF